jgi:predicted GIY-YIG superfamily endonuclease
MLAYECSYGHQWTRREYDHSAELEEWLSRPDPAHTEPRCALYRHYDESNVLLYIGITEAIATRGKAHAKRAEWVRYAHRVEAVWFQTRARAENAERHAIQTEQSVFNLAHADAGQPQRRLEYLANRKGWKLRWHESAL